MILTLNHRHIFTGVMLLFLMPLKTRAVWATDSPGALDFCVRPLRPHCVGLPETYKSKSSTLACQQDISAYVGKALDYRACLGREIGRVNLDANKVIDYMKCRADHRKGCADLAPELNGPCLSAPCTPRGG